MERAECRVQLKSRKASKALMLMLELSGKIDQLANSSLVWSCLQKGIRF